MRVNGIDLHYEQYGSDGPALIVAHGLMGSVALTKTYGEDLRAFAAKGIRVYAYDARGHGRSGFTRRRADYRWSVLGEEMYGFIRALGLERASVYGGSMGAGSALVCALEHPEVVERLILRSPPPFDGKALKVARGTFGGLATLYELFGAQITSRMVMALPPTKRAQTLDPAHDLRLSFASQRRASIVPAIRGVLFDERLPVHRFAEITQPTLILTHPDDEIHPLASGDLLHDRIPHAKLAVAPAGGYWKENPDALPHMVASFVKGETIARGLPEKAHAHG